MPWAGLKDGEQEELPGDCPSAYGDLVKRCWAQEPATRPLIEIALKALQQAAPKEDLAKSWHFDATSKTALEGKKYALLPASSKDIQKVVSIYAHHPMPGYEVGSVQVIHNPAFNRAFEIHMAKLQERHQNPAFAAKWKWDSNPEWRQKVYELFESMAAPYTDPDYPAVKLLPLWHGTQAESVDGILRAGFANLASTDAGFFGKGLYSAFEAEYAQRVYSQGALFLNWVAIYSAYPTIEGDMGKLTEKGNYQNYDAHFVPVVPKTSNPNESSYFPCKPNQKHTYTEVVVFDSAACLPRYLVQLQPILTKTLPPAKQRPLPSSSATAPLPATAVGKTNITGSVSSPQVQPKATVMPLAPVVAKAQPTALPGIIIGKADWERFFGDVGEVPPLPADITTILNSPCLFWPGKKVHETHMLVLVPKTVSGKLLTLDSLGELIQHPKQGAATKYSQFYWDNTTLKKQYGAKSLDASRWVLMTKDVLPGSRNKSYGEQQKIVADLAEKSLISYEVPGALESAACILSQYFGSNIRLFSDNPWTYTRCKEKVQGYQMVVGGFAPACLCVFYYDDDDGIDGIGVAALRKF